MKNIKQIKQMIFWYLKEQQSIFLPIILVELGLWYVVSMLMKKIIRKKRKDKIVAAFTSIYYNGNAKAVYEHMKKNEKYDCYWIARNRKSFFDVKKRGGNVIYAYFPFIGAYYLLNTDLLITNDSCLIFLFPHKDFKAVQVKHGVGPKGSDVPKSEFEMFDAWCVPSEYIKQRHIKLWDAPPEKLYVTGFARMDYLYDYLKMPKEKLLEEIGIKNGRKIILYAPTFDIGLWPWGDAYEEFEKLCKFCKENNLILILRLHPLAKVKKRKIKKIIKKYDNVCWLDMPKEPDTMKLLAITDILITDWSSIYTDYFLTKRPIIYIEINKDFFTRERGKPEVPPEYRAGEIVRNNEEFYEALKLVLKEGNRHKDKQEELLRIIHGNVDGKSTERVIEVIEKLTN